MRNFTAASWLAVLFGLLLFITGVVFAFITGNVSLLVLAGPLVIGGLLVLSAGLLGLQTACNTVLAQCCDDSCGDCCDDGPCCEGGSCGCCGDDCDCGDCSDCGDGEHDHA